MHDETGSASELFLTFLQLARIASDQIGDDESLAGVTLGMHGAARHASCCSCDSSEIEHEAHVHEL